MSLLVLMVVAIAQSQKKKKKISGSVEGNKWILADFYRIHRIYKTEDQLIDEGIRIPENSSGHKRNDLCC